MHDKHAILIEIKRQCEKLKIQINEENPIDLSWVTDNLYHIMLYGMHFAWEEFEIIALVVDMHCLHRYIPIELLCDHHHDHLQININISKTYNIIIKNTII
jgi:hypothetical protein